MQMPIIKFYIPIKEYFAVVTKIYKHIKTLIFLKST